MFSGPVRDAPDVALMLIRSESREGVNQFVSKDPYVAAGVVTDWSIMEWDILIGTPPD